MTGDGKTFADFYIRKGGTPADKSPPQVKIWLIRLLIQDFHGKFCTLCASVKKYQNRINQKPNQPNYHLERQIITWGVDLDLDLE